MENENQSKACLQGVQGQMASQKGELVFTERELQLILNLLDSDLHDLTVELVRQRKLERDVTSLDIERAELDSLIDKVRDLFLAA